MAQTSVHCEQRKLPSIRTCFPLRPMLAHTYMPKGNGADRQKVCNNLSAHVLCVGPVSTIQCRNDYPKLLERMGKRKRVSFRERTEKCLNRCVPEAHAWKCL